MRSLVAWSARFRILILGAALAVLVLGVAQLPSASLDTLPEFGPATVEVQTEALGLSAEEVEQLITVPLESGLLNGVAFLDSIESESVQGLSSILLTFEPGTDPIRARQMVAERLTQAHALPNVSRPPVMLQPLSSANRLMMVSLSSAEHSLIDLSVLSRWTIKPRLMGVPGVANVAIWGQRERQLQVTVDPQRLRDANVSLDDVIETTGNALWVSPLTFLEASTPGTGGFIDTPNQRLNVQHLLPIDTADDLARVPIETGDPNAPNLRLGDVAEVVEDHQPLIGDGLVNDQAGLMLVIEKFPEASVSEVTAGVEKALAAMAPGLSGVEFDTTVYRPATFIDSAVTNVGIAALLGLLLMAIVIGLFADWRAAAISVVSVLVSLTGAALVLHFAGWTMNAMTTLGFAVAIALVVDDAVVGTHRIMREVRARNGGSHLRRTEIVIRAISRVRTPVVYAMLAIGLAAGPFFLLGGVTGALLPQALGAYLLAVGASMVSSLTVAPSLAILLGERSMDRPQPRMLAAAERRYARALNWTIDRPRALGGAVAGSALAAVLLFGFAIVPTLGRSDLPDFRERDLLIDFSGPPGTSHPEMGRIIAAASRELRALDGVRGIGGHVGRAVTSDRIVGINAGQIWVSIAADADYVATRRAIEAVAVGYPGIDGSVSTHSGDRIDRILDPEAEDLTVRVFGTDLHAMRASAAEVRDAIAQVDGIVTAAVEPQVDEPTIDIQVDLEAAGDRGLRPGDVRRAAATLLSGIEVGSLFEDQKVFEVIVWGAERHRRSLSDVRDLPIQSASGELVALGDVADISLASSPTVIRRAAVQGVIDVGATISGRDVGSVVADVSEAVAAVDFPLESHAELLGHTATREANWIALLSTAGAAAVGIFLLLQAAFGSWRLAGLVFIVVLAALLGGIVVGLAVGGVSSIGVIAGLMGVLGLAIRTGLIQVDRYRELQERAGAQFGRRMILRGSREQLAPTLLTGLGCAAALLPSVVVGDRAGLEVLQPMTLVILGGLLSSMLVNLLVLPSLFLQSGWSLEAEGIAVPSKPMSEQHVIGAR